MLSEVCEEIQACTVTLQPCDMFPTLALLVIVRPLKIHNNVYILNLLISYAGVRVPVPRWVGSGRVR